MKSIKGLKTVIAISACTALTMGAVFAQEDTAAAQRTQEKAGIALEEVEKDYDGVTIETITPENQHVTDKSASVEIKYMPMYDEARIYYRCMYVTYDKGEAMNTVLACLEDFAKDHKYKRYTYLTRDKESYSKNPRGYNEAQYMSYVKFIR